MNDGTFTITSSPTKSPTSAPTYGEDYNILTAIISAAFGTSLIACCYGVYRWKRNYNRINEDTESLDDTDEEEAYTKTTTKNINDD